MTLDPQFNTITETISSLEAEMIAFQQAITAIPALCPTSGGEGEWDKAMYIREYLTKHGVANIQQIDAPDPAAKNGVRPNLIARIPGESNAKTIWLMAHTDVVPEGDVGLWDSDPWQAIVKDGKIYGRGTEDNQQGVTSSVFVLRAFIDARIKPRYDVAVILAADEETGSALGLEYLLEHHREMFSDNDIIVVPDAGEPDSTMIEVAEKSILWLKFTTEGKQCHASTPDAGVNAFRAASELVVNLDALHSDFAVRDEVFNPPISTFQPTKKEANVGNVNTIPGQDVFYLDCRILPTIAPDKVLEQCRKYADAISEQHGVKVSIDIEQRADAAPATPANATVVELLKRGIKQVYGVDATAQGIGGGTVAAVFRAAGLHAAVWSTLDDMCHQPNEYCVIDHMVNDTKVFAHLCLED